MPLFLALVLLLGGGTTTVLASDSLPGDILYPVKIHINENVESFLAMSDKSDAEVNAKQANNRLVEAETLSLNGLLDEKLNLEIKNNFNMKIISLNKHIENLEKDGATTTALKIDGEFKGKINDHYKAFLLVSGVSTSTGTFSTTSPLFKLFSRENDDSSNENESEEDNSGRNNDEKKSLKIGKDLKVESRIDSEGVENENDDEDDDDESSSSSVQSQTTVQGSINVSVPPVSTQKSFTLAEVQKHNTSVSCYTIVNGSVYDVTTWINQHPGGKSAITGMCGLDSSSAFTNQHAGQARPESELISFKIGILAK